MIKTSNDIIWYSTILEEKVSFFNLTLNDLQQTYNNRFSQSFTQINDELKHSLKIRVGNIGQSLYLANKIRPSGLVTQQRREWIDENTRDNEIIKGIKNIQILFQDILKEMPDTPYVYRGLHGEIASYIKNQLDTNDKIIYPTRAIEFWSHKFSTAVTFAFEGIGRKRANTIQNAVIISKPFNIKEVLEISGDDISLLPVTDKVIISKKNIQILR